jgi:hypothetical protein
MRWRIAFVQEKARQLDMQGVIERGVDALSTHAEFLARIAAAD